MAIKSVFFLLLCFTLLNCETQRDWVEIELPYGSGCLGNVIWTGNQFAALSESNITGRNILTSPDGINWTRNEIALSASGAGKLYNQELKWLNNQYVVLVPINEFNSTKAYIATSNDGINWTQILATDITKGFDDIVWADQQYIAVGNFGSVSSSNDLTNWTNHILTVSDCNPDCSFRSIYYEDHKYFATGNIGALMYKSIDGVNWRKIDGLPYDGVYRFSMMYENKSYIAYDNDNILISTDTKTWTSRTILGPELQFLTCGFNDYVGVSNVGNGALEIWSSKDLSIWRQYEYKPAYKFPESLWGRDRYFTGVAHNGERYVVTGYEEVDSGCAGGFILTSP